MQLIQTRAMLGYVTIYWNNPNVSAFRLGRCQLISLHLIAAEVNPGLCVHGSGSFCNLYLGDVHAVRAKLVDILDCGYVSLLYSR